MWNEQRPGEAPGSISGFLGTSEGSGVGEPEKAFWLPEKTGKSTSHLFIACCVPRSSRLHEDG